MGGPSIIPLPERGGHQFSTYLYFIIHKLNREEKYFQEFEMQHDTTIHLIRQPMIWDLDVLRVVVPKRKMLGAINIRVQSR